MLSDRGLDRTLVRVEYGIQRRSIYLVPPAPEGLEWIFRCFDDPIIYADLGLSSPSGEELRRRHAGGDHVFALIKSAPSKERIGFVVVFPPSPAFDAWSFSYAIPSAQHRNGFNALHTTDAMSHYMFEHLRVDAVGFETREDNGAAAAIVRRLGYTSLETLVIEGRRFQFYRVDRAAWAKRRAKLDAGELKFPSGIGGTFVKLNAPFCPVVTT